ncbi:hypothetical protein PanWU01x14_017610 [Parasponia andersonii]|uniref:Uncharacterized protein n=1 Tax=Parasponia andersonii TaxID=3476 RepID=A0A2P5DZZ7_PARAD|nr:hypothetical protein PanWU01x14_017610 [Parasponia andersonii]
MVSRIFRSDSLISKGGSGARGWWCSVARGTPIRSYSGVRWLQGATRKKGQKERKKYVAGRGHVSHFN